jgi:hypothetical protein
MTKVIVQCQVSLAQLQQHLFFDCAFRHSYSLSCATTGAQSLCCAVTAATAALSGTCGFIAQIQIKKEPALHTHTHPPLLMELVLVCWLLCYIISLSLFHLTMDLPKRGRERKRERERATCTQLSSHRKQTGMPAMRSHLTRLLLGLQTMSGHCQRRRWPKK